MIFAIITAYLAYKYASRNGRNGWAWGLIGALVFIGAQLAVSFAGGILLGVGSMMFGWPEESFDDAMFVAPITVLGLGASILASWLLLRYLDKPIGGDFPDLPTPPPPPTFGNDR